MKIIALILLLVFVNQIRSQDTIIPLWPKGKIPNAIVSNEKEVVSNKDILIVEKVQEPTLEVYLPSKKHSNGQAVVIFPGGGYRILAYDYEGTDFAKLLNSRGIVGIVVKYRLPSDKSQLEKHVVPLIDAQRAIRLVRSKAKDWNIESDKVGILGFSAGGHLASTLGNRFDEKVYSPIDTADEESARPYFMALGYPVITFGETSTHKGSQGFLLGDSPSDAMLTNFSNEKQVRKNTPPTFLVHAQDDESVPVENSLLFYKALTQKGVPATMHIYPKGGHGFALALNDKNLRGWTERLFEWLEGFN